jgi:tRNA(Ile)-lysidine synthetase-like protein
VTDLASRVEAAVRRHDLIPPGGSVTCLVSGGPDSTCLWHVLHELGYAVTSVHVAHGLRGAESEADAAFCRDVLGAEIVACDAVSRGASEAELRAIRYDSTATYGLRATGHTASDQVETVLYRLVSSGNTKGIKRKREDGVVRPLLDLWREETVGYCEEHGLEYRLDSSNSDTKRGLIRDEILPLLRRLHPAAERNLLALADEPARLPRELERTLKALLASTDGTKRADLGGEIRAVREYDEVRLEGRVTFGPWRIEGSRPGLAVRTRRPGDRLAGRTKKIQDVFVDAKVPRRERDEWPLVVSGDEVVAVPGIVAAPGWEDAVRAWKDAGSDAACSCSSGVARDAEPKGIVLITGARIDGWRERRQASAKPGFARRQPMPAGGTRRSWNRLSGRSSSRRTRSSRGSASSGPRSPRITRVATSSSSAFSRALSSSWRISCAS